VVFDPISITDKTVEERLSIDGGVIDDVA